MENEYEGQKICGNNGGYSQTPGITSHGSGGAAPAVPKTTACDPLPFSAIGSSEPDEPPVYERMSLYDEVNLQDPSKNTADKGGQRWKSNLKLIIGALIIAIVMFCAGAATYHVIFR